jgi:hypothetical protein
MDKNFYSGRLTPCILYSIDDVVVDLKFDSKADFAKYTGLSPTRANSLLKDQLKVGDWVPIKVSKTMAERSDIKKGASLKFGYAADPVVSAVTRHNVKNGYLSIDYENKDYELD